MQDFINLYFGKYINKTVGNIVILHGIYVYMYVYTICYKGIITNMQKNYAHNHKAYN